MWTRSEDPTRVELQANARRFVAVAAAAVIALASMFAFIAAEDRPSRVMAADVPLPSSLVVRTEGPGVVRARGGGVVEGSVRAVTPSGSVSGASGRSDVPPTDTGRTTREEVEDEMRERFGSFVDTPAGQAMVDAATELAEGGESVDDAVDEAAGPTPSPDGSGERIGLNGVNLPADR